MLRQEELLNRFIREEGLKLQPYICPAGYLTIGIGHNLQTNPLTAEEKKVCGDYNQGITRNAAVMIFRNDIKKLDQQLYKYISFYGWLDDERQYALLDMAFNMGLVGLLQFRKMLYSMEIGDYRGAAKEVLNSKYAKDVPNRAKRMAKIIETGDYEW